MRITNSGGYEYCRWADAVAEDNISNISPVNFFQKTMQPLRDKFTQGQMPTECHTCQSMEKHNKISGRQKQLLKVGVQLDRFEKTLMSSSWINEFTKSTTAQLPQDWQIDLGNYCNSACVFCVPEFSSRVASEWKRIGFINELPAANWVDDPVLVDKFISTLRQSPHIQYLHFIGGETLITPAFKTILEALIQSGLNRTATIGFTTNLITWDDSVVDLLKQFAGVNLGMSVEAFNIVNDYVRWPSTLPKIHETLDQWLDVAKQQNWLMQFRTTPTILTVGHLLSVYEYAWNHNIAVESCNFLINPEFMRPSVLPPKYRQAIITRLEQWIKERDLNQATIVNTRDPHVAQQQLVQDLKSYVNYLNNEPDDSYRLPELVKFLKQLETSRGNSILTYLPEYEELFRSAGY